MLSAILIALTLIVLMQVISLPESASTGRQVFAGLIGLAGLMLLALVLV